MSETRTHRMVVALGGNALSTPGTVGDITSQFAQTRRSAGYIADLVVAGHKVLLTHGNGPQVGMALRRVELSRHEVYPLDLGLCGANTQAGMGYMICQCVENELRRRKHNHTPCTIITSVMVDRQDPAFGKPTKPIGQTYDRETAETRARSEGWNIVEVPGRGFRRVVPSPMPRRILELELILRLFNEGHLVVCCGGGGIPVVERPDGDIEGVEAVIDKDLTAALLAESTEADTLAILTEVDRVCLFYGTPQERALDTMTVSQARVFLADGQFPPGSMGPKIQACIEYLEKSPVPDAQAVITSLEGFADALQGKAGTRIVRD